MREEPEENLRCLLAIEAFMARTLIALTSLLMLFKALTNCPGIKNSFDHIFISNVRKGLIGSHLGYLITASSFVRPGKARQSRKAERRRSLIKGKGNEEKQFLLGFLM